MVKRISKRGINTVLFKLLSRELHDVEKIINDKADVLLLSGDSFTMMQSGVHRDLIIDYLIDYSDGLKIELKELEESLNVK